MAATAPKTVTPKVVTPKTVTPRAVAKAVKEPAPTRRLDQRLVLFGYMLGLFGADTFEQLVQNLNLAGRPELEEWDEENVSGFHYVLRTAVRPGSGLSADKLLGYDENIGRHWRAITAARGPLTLKYFQYLILLFTEIYLDRYFSDADGFCRELNRAAAHFNQSVGAGDAVGEYDPDSLRKIAFWSATGSGKTLLMHVGLLQYRHYLDKAGRGQEINRVLLLTPTEELTEQHLQELALSGIDAVRFSKTGGGLYMGLTVEALEFSKLGEEMGDKVVAVGAFGDNNLVLVDEGHRGAGGTDEGWMDRRDRLSARGFSLEYSATFGQAMAAAGKPALTRTYARCLLFDYSYKYFHGDGYGKEYRILNLPAPKAAEAVRAQETETYLLGCLLAFYQQVRVFGDERTRLAPYLFDPPLCVFVGGRVAAVRKEDGRETTDVLDILHLLASAAGDRIATVARLTRLLDATTPLLDAEGRDIFAGRFAYLQSLRLAPEALYEDLLRRVFHAPAPGRLHVENLKGQDGEIALRIGDNEPFGLINVGDTAELLKLCRKQEGLVVTDREFGQSLFAQLDAPDTRLQLLIGSKKFSAGWSSWRVGTMGLMRIGQSEGAEIIQLFGRGVRLRGYGFGLKRSDRIPGLHPPPSAAVLETLNVFGVRADYMKTFQDEMDREGLAEASRFVEIILPVVLTPAPQPLKTLRVRPGLDFRRDGPPPTLAPPSDALIKSPIALDWYLKIQSRASVAGDGGADGVVPHEGVLTERHLAFLDWDAVLFALEDYKALKGWHGLRLTRATLRGLLADTRWYTLSIPAEDLEWTAWDKPRLWEEIAVALLKKYCDKFCKYAQSEYELPQLEYHPLEADDPNLPREYRVQIEATKTLLTAQMQDLKGEIDAGTFAALKLGTLQAIRFDRHLYYPLIAYGGKEMKFSPVPLDKSEADFVQDLKKYTQENTAFFSDKTLYLLRNQSRGRGIGFFEAGNFYPDFLLWLLVGDRQYITFVDPKGIRNLGKITHDKIQLYRKIKDIEARLADPTVTLNSFILSNTKLQEIPWADDSATYDAFAQSHVLFQQEHRSTYIGTLLHALLEEPA